MNRLLVLAGTTLGGYLGWAAGDAAGLGLLGCFLISGLGSVLGVYAGWKAARRFG